MLERIALALIIGLIGGYIAARMFRRPEPVACDCYDDDDELFTLDDAIADLIREGNLADRDGSMILQSWIDESDDG